MTLSESEFYRPSAPDQEPSQWRQEIAQRVRAHRARRRRRSGGEDCLDLQFDAPANATAAAEPPAQKIESHPANQTEASFWSNNMDHAPMLETSGPAFPSIDLSEAPIVPETREPLPPFPRIKPRTQERKVIEFPRLNEASVVSREELAEPIGDQLRIFEALEEMPAPAPGHLADIRLESPEPEEPMGAKLDLPLPVASLEKRWHAAAVDASIFAVGLTTFAVTALELGRPVAFHKQVMLAVAGCIFLLLAVYQLLFLFWGRSTPGMQAVGLTLCAFSGERPSRNLRAARALAWLLSCSSLALGLVWAFIDEDRLCWHDRITHTYLRDSS